MRLKRRGSVSSVDPRSSAIETPRTTDSTDDHTDDTDTYHTPIRGGAGKGSVKSVQISAISDSVSTYYSHRTVRFSAR